MHFLNQGYHFREAYAGDKTQLFATRALTCFKHSVRHRDEDGDMINLWDDSSGFSFGEILRSAKEIKERDF